MNYDNYTKIAKHKKKYKNQFCTIPILLKRDTNENIKSDLPKETEFNLIDEKHCYKYRPNSTTNSKKSTATKQPVRFLNQMPLSF